MIVAGIARHRRGFTVTELLVVAAVIVVLAGLLLPALAGVWSTGEMTGSMANMRQISLWLRAYANDNTEQIVPSRFNYRYDPYPGKVRSYEDPFYGSAHAGSWADIIAATFEVGVYPDAAAGGLGHDYRFATPDRGLYDTLGDDEAISDPFRSTAPNSHDAPGLLESEPPKPYGKGAQERGYRGFFAANNFFDADRVVDPSHVTYTMGQIKSPDRSLYLIDSFYGLTIADAPAPFDMTDANADGVPDDGEVDFRYSGGTECLMLFIDGHVEPQSLWRDITDLEGDPDDPESHGRGIRIRNLTKRR
jgi:prepilin-type N-terminal cleavage/methylation domain-containing protein